MAAMLAYGNPLATHPHLVICGIGSEAELAEVFNRLKCQGVPCISWNEDDMNDALTAVATGPLNGQERRPLRRFKLL